MCQGARHRLGLAFRHKSPWCPPSARIFSTTTISSSSPSSSLSSSSFFYILPHPVLLLPYRMSGLSPERLRVTVHARDDASADVWRKVARLPQPRVTPLLLQLIMHHHHCHHHLLHLPTHITPRNQVSSLPPSRILRLDSDDNLWSMGDGAGPRPPLLPPPLPLHNLVQRAPE